jgi:hypothetical protein
MFHTKIDQSLFNIQIVDFFSKMENKINGNKNCLDSLYEIVKCPQLNNSYQMIDFINALDELKKWYEDEAIIKSWFPTINLSIDLSIKRSDIVSICGNMTKHSISHLSYMTSVLKNIMIKNEVELGNTEPELLLKEFYSIFNDDVLLYYSSNIAEMLNNIRWNIHHYLLPVYKSFIRYDENVDGKYFYTFPDNIQTVYAKNIFWDLMNKTRSGPIICKFEVQECFKMHY